MNYIRLVETSWASPEQYDAFLGDREVGYLRLRHGKFTVDYLYCGGEQIYYAEPKGNSRFEDDEREFYLNEAINAINAKLDELHFQKLSFENPEQYDVFRRDQSVAYIRVANHKLTVSFPYPGGEEIFTTDIKGNGVLEPNERDDVLERAKIAIAHRLAVESQKRGSQW